MGNVKMYYLCDRRLTGDHKRKISVAMRRYYAANPMTVDHKQKIGESMKRVWAMWKRCWAEQG